MRTRRSLRLLVIEADSVRCAIGSPPWSSGCKSPLGSLAKTAPGPSGPGAVWCSASMPQAGPRPKIPLTPGGGRVA